MDAEVDQDVLLWLNWCRLYLQVCTISDIVTADGSRIRQAVWHGQRDAMFRSMYQWPRTARPTKRHWDMWRRVLATTLLLSHGPTQPLRSPLGRWHDPLDRWKWLLSPSEGTLFHREGSTWKSFRRNSAPSPTLGYLPPTPSPGGMVPCHQTSNGQQYIGKAHQYL